MRHLKIFLIIISFSALSACVGIYEDGNELASVVNNDIEEVTVDDLKNKIDNGDEFYLIDVRQENEYLKGNIEGSFNIPRGELEFKINDTIFWGEQFFYEPLDTSEIVIYCKAGGRGTLAVHSLLKLGYTNVKSLKGGIIAWDPELAKSTNKPKEDSGCGG